MKRGRGGRCKEIGGDGWVVIEVREIASDVALGRRAAGGGRGV